MQIKHNIIKKTVTVFNYIRDGRECKGFLSGKLNAAQVQASLLARRIGCAKVWAVGYTVI